MLQSGLPGALSQSVSVALPLRFLLAAAAELLSLQSHTVITTLSPGKDQARKPLKILWFCTQYLLVCSP